MNVFELILFWGVSVCGLAAFKAVEGKAGFWGGSVVFVLAAGGAFLGIQFVVKRFSRKPRKAGVDSNDASEKKRQ
jgi:hypothetical protein